MFSWMNGIYGNSSMNTSFTELVMCLWKNRRCRPMHSFTHPLLKCNNTTISVDFIFSLFFLGTFKLCIIFPAISCMAVFTLKLFRLLFCMHPASTLTFFIFHSVCVSFCSSNNQPVMQLWDKNRAWLKTTDFSCKIMIDMER